MESLHDWMIRASHASYHRNLGQWRCHAIKVMARTVEPLVLAARPLVPNRDALIAAVDAVYPFGARKHHPYKAWLQERAIFIDAISGGRLSADELGALEVAIDLIELKREDEARTLVELEAPNRNARPCPVCGARRKQPCREPDLNTTQVGYMFMSPMNERIVPHLARYQPPEETREHDDDGSETNRGTGAEEGGRQEATDPGGHP